MAGHFKVELMDFAVGRPYRQVVRTLGELFYLAWEAEGDVFSFGVFHFGPKNKTKFFKYGIKIGNSAEYVAVIRECHSYLEGRLKDIHPGKCATIHYGTIQECLGENGNLSCEIEIRKCVMESFAVEDMQECLQVCCATCSTEPDSGSRAIAAQQQQQVQQEQQQQQQQVQQEQQQQQQQQQVQQPQMSRRQQARDLFVRSVCQDLWRQYDNSR
jgi:hypothetical protein